MGSLNPIFRESRILNAVEKLRVESLEAYYMEILNAKFGLLYFKFQIHHRMFEFPAGKRVIHNAVSGCNRISLFSTRFFFFLVHCGVFFARRLLRKVKTVGR